jgi:hypothetical protein
VQQLPKMQVKQATTLGEPPVGGAKEISRRPIQRQYLKEPAGFTRSELLVIIAIVPSFRAPGCVCTARSDRHLEAKSGDFA